MEVVRSAHRHGIASAEMDHVLRNAVVLEEIADDPTRYLLLGPDRAGNLLELVVLGRPQGPAVIHAMSMTAQYRDLLPEGG